MKPSEMDAIYAEACRAASNRPVPEPAQAKIWKQTMIGFDAVDIRGGLERWWRGEIYLPMPAQLKPLAERARMARLSQSQEKTDLVRWHCPECGIHRSGFISPQDHAPRACTGIARLGGGVCGAILNEIFRKPSAEMRANYARG